MRGVICESCIEAMVQEGCARSEARWMCRVMGADIPDHICDEVETDGRVRCQCECRRY